MTHSPTALAHIKVFLCDSDGVLFPNTVLMGTEEKSKYRSYYDGQGISLLRAIGIRIAIITNERGTAAQAVRETVQKYNSLPSSKPSKEDGWEPVTLYEDCGGFKKVEAATDFLSLHNASFEETAFMGDDLVDIPLLEKVAVPCAPASAEELIKNISTFVAARNGGEGAVRDFANAVLAARGIDPTSFPPQ